MLVCSTLLSCSHFISIKIFINLEFGFGFKSLFRFCSVSRHFSTCPVNFRGNIRIYVLDYLFCLTSKEKKHFGDSMETK